MKNTYANKPSKLQAFTIVELLIVIVVIAILAAISIAAYTNIQQRAKNTAIINAASQSLKMIQAYIAENGAYPFSISSGTAWLCVTTDMTCVWDNGSVVPARTSFNDNMAKVGSLPKSVPVSGSNGNGLTVFYSPDFTQNGVSTPFTLQYWLIGTNQKCGLGGVVTVAGNVLTPSTSGYTNGSVVDGTKTTCRISVPGPVHS
ncbi:type II secretion system protein [Candidatus Saccharibacteria bacterium]|nr:type II secretion system protein [Candidatus Saccharibacteria bacterium]